MASKKSRPPRPTRYWHGGFPGLAVGEALLPAQTTGHKIVDAKDKGVLYEHDSTSVYISNDKQFARAFAAWYGTVWGGDRGDLYEVEPQGSLFADPDYSIGPEVSFRCHEARIVAVEARAVRMTETEATRAHAPYAFWPDGSPQYDRQGYMLPSAEMVKRGVRPARLKQLGRWKPVEQATGVIAAELRSASDRL